MGKIKKILGKETRKKKVLIEKKLLLFYNWNCPETKNKIKEFFILQSIKKGAISLFDNYIKNFGFLQVNVSVKNYYGAETSGKASSSVHDDVWARTGQEEVSEESSTAGKPIDWDLAEDFEENINDLKEKYLPSKLKTLKLEDIYLYRGDYVKAEKVHHCGTYLEFEIDRDATIDKKRLKKINSCKYRLCPYCAWRRALRTYSNVKKCYDYLERQDMKKRDELKSRFVFMTLTTKNVVGAELESAVNDILAGFDRLRRFRAFENAFEGFVRALEVTCDREPYITREMYRRKKDYYCARSLNVGEVNPNYLFFNVHIHVLCHTTYARYKENYIEQSLLAELWQRALKVDYLPVVDIRAFRAKSRETKGQELAEIAKYTVKPADYLKADYQEWRKYRLSYDSEFALDAEIIGYLDAALAGRRLLAFGGSFRKAYQALKLEDDKMVDDEEKSSCETYILKYYFSFKDKLYKRIVK